MNSWIDDSKNCPLEGNCNWQFLYKSAFKNYNLPIYQCNTCGLQKVHPIPENWSEYYTEEYYTGKSEYSYLDERENIKYNNYSWDSRISIILSELKKIFPNKNLTHLKILEVGSSFGGFLKRVQYHGHSAFGIEISKYSSDVSNQSGIITHNGSLEDSPYPPKSFDAIVLSEVVEHLPTPKTSFEKLVDLMSDQSLLLIQTANFEGWQARQESKYYHYYLPGHLYYYSESNLKKILNHQGINKFKVFYGSDVSLLSKLKKMRGNFTSISDYKKWIPTSIFHIKSKFKKKGFPLTSGFVLYAFKGGRD